ncbi:putative ABC transport system permease protein [Anaerobacterium chartisolvens]|uniref:Putative ABC transport system permease protein n=1 Tax=Anaerobacterium chartisolvens TaxID=1297424 RepID=A0A369B480_9FIRM|nr:ABC transporter permease [Anaerobacterium chartisolvens]RCX16115.1 putative ABC transport system permease protein [Anaerobacterium chartisolvens]
MVKGLFRKLARANLVRNKGMYIPYVIATVIMSSMYFIIINIVFSKSISNMSFGPTMQAMLTFGLVVMSLFTIAYMLYINSFLIKRRKQEFGLYAVLGLEKRHVGKIILWESAMLNTASMALGFLFGVVFGKLAFVLLLKIVKTAPNSKYVLSPSAFVVTAVIFAGIFVLTTIYNLNQVRLAKPVELLSGKRKGEKKVRGVVPLTIIGLILLCTAYTVSITAKIPASALLLFWPAVILVIIATWMLFTAGSVFLLRALKRNKGYYYKPGNFIAVSGLMHRLKQNASGLYNICILSTMVLVTVSGCCALYFGQEEILSVQNPNDLVISINYNKNYAKFPNADKARETIDALAREHGVAIESMYTYKSLSDNLIIKNGEFIFKNKNGDISVGTEDYNDNYFYVYITTQEEYNAVTGEKEDLGSHELLLLTDDDIGSHSQLTIQGTTYAVKEIISGTKFTAGKNSVSKTRLFIVASDDAAALELRAVINPSAGSSSNDRGKCFSFTTVINLKGDNSDCAAYSVALSKQLYSAATDGLDTGMGYSYRNIFTNRQQSNGMFGGLLFLGAFFTILFLTNTILIIYFKQISEGFDDRDRFVIMQKVGMSDDEVKSTINKQILIIFFLPLATALLHVAAAGNMIIRLLEAFALFNGGLTIVCISATSVVFALAYIFVYRFTAKAYYRIVRW